jgi:UDP-3-O-[3-hydroxymyristoyl] glucosamine N-acyltransferase
VIIGGSAIKDHTTLGGAIIGAGSGVVSDVPAGKTVLGYPAVEARDALKQWAILKDLLTNLRSKRIDFIIFIKNRSSLLFLCLK